MKDIDTKRGDEGARSEKRGDVDGGAKTAASNKGVTDCNKNFEMVRTRGNMVCTLS